MKTNFEKVKEFHEVFDCSYNDIPTVISDDEANLRLMLMREELEEVKDAIFSENIQDIAKELADLLYVTYGTAIAYGIDIDKVFEEVHNSNMSKVGPDGQVRRRFDGKILKPETYQPPDLSFLK